MDVVAAVIKQDGKFLVQQRAASKEYGGKWEFPGGKVEGAESFENALRREIKEELDIHIDVGMRISTWYLENTKKEKYNIHFYVCRISSGNVCAMNGQDVLWASPEEFKKLDLIRADLQVFLFINGEW